MHPEDVHLLASEADAKKIIKHVRVGDEESKENQFYEEAESDVERKKWLSCPYPNVKEHLLPMIKASFLCYSKGIREELLALVEKRIKEASMRKDPTLANYKATVNKFMEKAN